MIVLRGTIKNLQIGFCCCNIDVDKIKFIVCNLFEDDVYRVELLHKFYINGYNAMISYQVKIAD